jgi:hypothetical protein
LKSKRNRSHVHVEMSHLPTLIFHYRNVLHLHLSDYCQVSDQYSLCSRHIKHVGVLNLAALPVPAHVVIDANITTLVLRVPRTQTMTDKSLAPVLFDRGSYLPGGMKYVIESPSWRYDSVQQTVVRQRGMEL